MKCHICGCSCCCFVFAQVLWDPWIEISSMWYSTQYLSIKFMHPSLESWNARIWIFKSIVFSQIHIASIKRFTSFTGFTFSIHLQVDLCFLFNKRSDIFFTFWVDYDPYLAQNFFDDICTENLPKIRPNVQKCWSRLNECKHQLGPFGEIELFFRIDVLWLMLSYKTYLSLIHISEPTRPY